MRKLLSCLRRIVCLMVVLLAAKDVSANHLVGMDFFYTHLSGNTYKVTLIAYADCGSAGSSSAFGALPTNTPAVYIYNGSSYITTINLAIEPPSLGTEITPVCPAEMGNTQCTDVTFTIPGIKKFVYSTSYTVSGPSTVWRFLFTGDLVGSTAGRALTITNIPSSPVTTIQLVDTLNNSISYNSNPNLTNIPTPFFCSANLDSYNPGAVDPDGDSLSFFLVSAQNGSATSTPGGLVTYLFPYTGAAPLATSSFTFDQHTGQITFYPSALQRSLVVYNIEEYHSGSMRGTCQREMTFLVQTCTSTPPSGGFSGASGGIIDDSVHFHICGNSGPFTININPTEANPLNNITVTTSGLPTGATFSIAGNGTPTPHCVFSWTSTGVTPGSYTFFVTYTDNNCPLAGVQTIAYTVTILPAPAVSVTLLSSATCSGKGVISIAPSGAGGPWIVDMSSGVDTIQTFSGVTATFTDSLGAGSYVLTIYTSPAHACHVSTAVTMPGPPPMVISATIVNPSYCGGSDGSITIHHLFPGTIDTIRYTFNGTVHPPVIMTVAADSTVTLTGLMAGDYSNIYVTYDLCVSTTITLVSLLNPPFTMRALSFTNPIYCGVCTGTITIYGLHPGQTDTINYKRDGVAQPPVVHFVGTDSTVTITGLCTGTYSNFIAKTASVCISNTLGPVTLTAPPFTMRAIGFTNPDFCGLCNGSITLFGLHPGMFDTITYTMGGVPQPPFPYFVGGDSIVTITGLCAGTYSNFVAHTAGVCVSNMLGPVTLAVPPFTMRGYASTNPDFCGICNGSITLLGLHPGMTDTITYTLGGIAQPPVIHLVGADSTVSLAGLCAGTYDNFVAHAGPCISNVIGPVILTVPPFTMRALSHVNPDYCGICNGSITLYGLHPGETDTITYKLGGVAQPPIIHLIAADSTVTITGLCAGIYDSFVARTGGACVSNSLGPVALTVPPFTMRALSHTNPDYCGICNGTITLYGLHPGETDTITYTLGGVPQPPVIHLIAADSMVVLTGLCAGTYDNFVAHTGGACISNMLGPVDLTVPPFTIRSLSHTNPDFCGICNGTITIYGLHPGETDTINYTLGGMPQPPVVAVIPADSQVTLTGLCAGVYDNFVAGTGGACISNTLGPVALTVPPFTMRALSHTNPDFCGICNGTITLYGLHPGETDSISYTYGGVPQPPVVSLIGPDSTVTLTGLCTGTYDNFVARTGGACVSNMLGPVDLTVPPFTMRALSYTNPDFCGICNGSITLYGLYPGETDSIYYTFGGAPQPPYVHVVGADSTITMSGLCAGLYDNFVARTGGNCVSNTLGPAELVVPAFTMRTLTYTNPTKCGFCDGVIRLYGIHPGQTDTLTYTKDGVPQTPVSILIPPDSMIILTGLCEGTYDNFVAHTGGVCFTNSLGPVTLKAPPIVAGFAFEIHKNCTGDSVYFTNTSTPASDLTYTWHFGDTGTSVATNPVHVYHTPGTMTVTLVITNTRCVDSSTQTLTIDNLITAGFTANPDSFLCQGKPDSFTNYSTGTLMKYRWIFGDGGTDTVYSPVHIFKRAGLYHVTMAVSNYVPCYDTVQTEIAVDSNSAISVGITDTVICGGTTITFDGIFSDLGNTGMQWTIGGEVIKDVNPITYAFGSPGTYPVTLQAFYRACPDTQAHRDVIVFGKPEIYLGPDTTICPGSNAVKLVDNINEGNKRARWEWSTGETTPDIMVVSPGTYSATVIVDGCRASDSVTVGSGCYLDIPNAFTPNEDGMNDYFFPRNLLTKGLASFRMEIYNRWGQIIFETTNTDGRGWDGRFNGTAQPEGVYIFLIDATFVDGEKEHHTGNVTLLR